MFRFDLIAKAMQKEPNKFLLVHLLAKRTHQLADGATPMSSIDHSSDFNNVLQEFLDDTLAFKDAADAEKIKKR